MWASSANSASSPAGRRSSLPYAPGLDGLRALAVAAVFAYHAGIEPIRGGFLGVDVFFVISGYLVTALLMAERRAHGRISIRHFWARRARRLLPAVGLVLVVLAITIPFIAPDAVARLRGDTGAALGYFSNWRLIATDVSYFEASGRPPVLQHFWSLAVEEQFYLVWPVVMAVVAGRVGRRRLAGLLVVAAATSFLLMGFLAQGPGASSRAYFGTDTRFGALALGAALAAVGGPRLQDPGTWRRGQRSALTLAGMGAAAGLGACLVGFSELDADLYPWGFALTAVLAAVVVAAAAQPGRGGMAAVLGTAPLVWLGRRSYGIYLWYWPVLVLTRPGTDVAWQGSALVGAQAVITVALAALSYRFVEQPWRSGAAADRLAQLGRAARARVVPPAPALTALLIPALALGLIGVGTVVGDRYGRDEAREVAAALAEARATLDAVSVRPAQETPSAGAREPTTADGPDATEPSSESPASLGSLEAPDPPPTTDPEPAEPGPVPVAAPGAPPSIALGESVLLGAGPALAEYGFQVDAAVARQTPEVVAIAQALREQGRVGRVMVVHTGHNGPISAAQVDAILAAFDTAERVVVVGVKVHRGWQGPNNQVLSEAAERWGNATFLDWAGQSAAHPEWFYADGLHLTPPGRQAFAQAVAASL